MEWRTSDRWFVDGGLLVVLFVSLVALIVQDWSGLHIGSLLAFSGLALLAGVRLVRIYLAHRIAGSDSPGWQRRYVSHVYFTYTSLWVGFVIIPALRSPSPALWIPLAVVTVLARGSLLVHRYQRLIGFSGTPQASESPQSETRRS